MVKLKKKKKIYSSKQIKFFLIIFKRDAGQTKEYCKILWDGITNHECGCLTTGVASDRLAMDIDSVAFNAISYKVANEFKNSSSFTVVYQPGVTALDIKLLVFLFFLFSSLLIIDF